MGWPLGKPRRNSHPVTLDNETGCVLWTGSTDHCGHAVTFEKGKTVRVRQQQFEIAFGRKAKRLLPNSCGKANCIAPAHLVEGSFTKQQMAAQQRVAKRLTELSETIDRLEISCQTLFSVEDAQAELNIFEEQLDDAKKEQKQLLDLQRELNKQPKEEDKND